MCFHINKTPKNMLILCKSIQFYEKSYMQKNFSLFFVNIQYFCLYLWKILSKKLNK